MKKTCYFFFAILPSPILTSSELNKKGNLAHLGSNRCVEGRTSYSMETIKAPARFHIYDFISAKYCSGRLVTSLMVYLTETL